MVFGGETAESESYLMEFIDNGVDNNQVVKEQNEKSEDFKRY